LAARYSFSLVMWLSVIPLFLCFITSWWLIDVVNTEKSEVNVYLHLKEAWKNFVTNEKLRLLSLSSIIGFGISEAGFQFRSVFVASLWPLWAIGMAQMLSNIGAAISFGWSGKILKKFGTINILYFDMVYSKVINFISLIFPTVFSPGIMATSSVLYGPSNVAENSLFQKEFTDKQRATMGSLNSLGKSISFALSALLLGYVADWVSPRISLIWGQLVGLISVWLTWKLLRLIKKEQESQALV